MFIDMIKSALRKTFAYNIILWQRYGDLYKKLLETGNLVPPPYDVKRLVILTYAKLYHLATFVETGTLAGDTVDALKNDFENLYSIELQTDFYCQAKKRFAGFGHISILSGDSGKLLPEILSNIHTPCLFWLDAHYSSGNTARGSKDTPIIEELSHILSHPHDHVILIDDARLFTGQGDYPRLDQVKELILKDRPNYFFDVRHDIIRACKKSAGFDAK